MANKLPLVNYSGEAREIASGDKIPVAYLQGVDSVIEIPDTAFADPNNPTISEVETWILSNLTSEELIDSTIAYARDIILRPNVYNYNYNGFSSPSYLNITVGGTTPPSAVPTLDSIDIDAVNYPINLDLLTSTYQPLKETDFDTLTLAIETAFSTAGYTVEVGFDYYFDASYTGTNVVNRITPKIRQITGSSSLTFTVNYTKWDGTTSDSRTTNTATPTLVYSEIIETCSIENPSHVWKILNSQVYQLYEKNRESNHYVEANYLPTHDPINYPVGLLFKDTRVDVLWKSTKYGWEIVSKPEFKVNVETSDLCIYNGTPGIWLKIKPNLIYTYTKAIISVSYSSALYNLVLPNTSFTEIELDGAVYQYISTSGSEIYYLWEDTVSTRRKYSSSSSASNLYLFVEQLNLGSNINGNISITTNLVDTSTDNSLGIDSVFTSIKYEINDGEYALSSSSEIIRNNKLPVYTNTERDSVTLTNTSVDIGKKIWNSTIDAEQTWDGTQWLTTETGGSNGCTQYEFQSTDTNVNTAGIGHITSYNSNGTLKLNKIDASSTDLTNYYDNLGVGSIISIYSPETGDNIKFEITSKSTSSNHYIFGVDYLAGYTATTTLPQDVKFCVFLYIPDIGGLVTDVTATLPLTSSGGTTPDIDINIDSTTLQVSGSNLAAKNTSAIWNANKIQGRDVLNDTPVDGDVIKWVAANSRFEFLPDNISGASYTGAITTTGGSTTTLLSSSEYEQIFDGVDTQDVVLPDATTMQLWQTFRIYNNSEEPIYVQDDGLNPIVTLQQFDRAVLIVTDISSSNGVWAYILTPGKRSIFYGNSVVSSAGTEVLTKDSEYETIVTGTSTHDVRLPDATTLDLYRKFKVTNESTQDITVSDANPTPIRTIKSKQKALFTLTDNSTAQGVWNITLFQSNLEFSGTGPFTLTSENGIPVTFKEGTNITMVRTGNELEISAAGGGVSLGKIIAISKKFYL